MVLAQTILERILAHTSLKENLQFHEVVRFLDFTRRIWVEIVPLEENPPLELPANVAQLFSRQRVQKNSCGRGNIAATGRKAALACSWLVVKRRARLSCGGFDGRYRGAALARAGLIQLKEPEPEFWEDLRTLKDLQQEQYSSGSATMPYSYIERVAGKALHEYMCGSSEVADRVQGTWRSNSATNILFRLFRRGSLPTSKSLRAFHRIVHRCPSSII
ncbi:hypothetical protein R3P38DRAFT_3362437 [Favolaschia claudopus]|uniref:Uncharacterized protein n=1 Tax=Favolaschia claudopus TaxID=2862362 RepID=A0AAW0AMI2_9AGAR